MKGYFLARVQARGQDGKEALKIDPKKSHFEIQDEEGKVLAKGPLVDVRARGNKAYVEFKVGKHFWFLDLDFKLVNKGDKGDKIGVCYVVLGDVRKLTNKEMNDGEEVK